MIARTWEWVAGTPQRRLIAMWLAASVIACLLPAIPFFRSLGSLTILNLMGIQITFALSYNMLLGQGGMLSFGHAVYFGMGGFLAAHMMNFIEYDGWFIPLPLVPLAGGVFGLITAVLVGSFSTRRAGTIFAMISLGIGELLAASSVTFVSFFGGEEGVSADRTANPQFFGIEFLSDLSVYYLIVFWSFVCAALMYLFSRTPAGRMANAVRDNPERAEFIGYSQRMVRFISFCAAGFFAGVAGGLFAIAYEILTEANINLIASGNVLLMTYIGGAGHFLGPAIGAALLTFVQSVVVSYTDLWQLYIGVMFLLVVMFVPQGIAGAVVAHRTAYRAGRLRELAPSYASLGGASLGISLSAVALLEMLYQLRFGAVGDPHLTLYGLPVNAASVLWWAFWLAALAGSIWWARRVKPEALRAYDSASRLVIAPAAASSVVPDKKPAS